MGVVMGIMIVIMVIGFAGFGRHHQGMMGGHDEGHTNEAVIHDQDKEAPCPDCPASDEKKNEDPEKKLE